MLELQLKVSHDGLMTSCHLSDDGRLAMAGGDDNILTVWDVTSGQRLHQLRGVTFSHFIMYVMNRLLTELGKQRVDRQTNRD